jgi:pimeloyl-ACP methyl ester carboxylesterase
MTTGITAQDRSATVNGLRLHYLDYGNPQAPPLLFLHGLSGHAHTFDLVAPQVAGRYHALSLDVRGRGESDWAPDGDYTFPAYLADVAGLCEALGIARITLVGTSMGGLIAMMLAATRPDLVERAVINDIGPEIDPRGLARIQSYISAAPESFPDEATLLAWFRENYPEMLSGLSEEELRAWAGYSVKPGPAGGYVWRMDRAVRRQSRPDTGAPPPPPVDLWALVPMVSCPVLLVRGAISDVLAQEVAERFVAGLADGRLVTVPGLGHAPTLTEPEAVAALRKFLPGGEKSAN